MNHQYACHKRMKRITSDSSLRFTPVMGPEPETCAFFVFKNRKREKLLKINAGG